MSCPELCFDSRSSLAISCNFDVSSCGFAQDKYDKFDWTRNKGSTSSVGTGPSADHTGKGGDLKKSSNS